MPGELQRDVFGALTVLLRGLAGKATDQPAPEEIAACASRLFPTELGMDAAGFIAWTLLGMRHFADDAPPPTQRRREVRGLFLVLAMLRAGGNMSEAARLLDTSRKVVRDGLRSLDLHPWPSGDWPAYGDEDEPETPERSSDQDEPAAERSSERSTDPVLLLRALDPVIEDGSAGVLWWRAEGDGWIGPAWLERGDRSDRLFMGWWVDRATAQAYAEHHGHRLHVEDGPASAEAQGDEQGDYPTTLRDDHDAS